MNRSWADKAWDATTEWVDKNTDYLIGAGLLVAGGIATFIPVVGPFAGPALMSAGVDVMVQRFAAGKDGEIDYRQVAVSGVLGAAGGVGGVAVKGMVKAGTLSVSQGLVRTAAIEGGLGATGNVVNYALDDKTDFTVGGAFLQGTAGLVTGGNSALMKPLSDAAGTAGARQLGAVPVAGALDDVKLNVGQVLAKNAGNAGVNTVVSAENSVITQTMTTGDLKGDKFLQDTFLGGSAKTVITGSSGDLIAQRSIPGG